jgi:putative membrane protein
VSQLPADAANAGGDRVQPPAAGAGTGSKARDHLANERTYLAWLRTAFGMLALTAAVARFGTGNGAHDHLAVGILGALGVFILALGTRRYYQVARDLEAGRFTFSRRTPLVLAIVILVTAVVLLPLLA